MTWIAMRCNLAEDPAVLQIAKRLGVDEFAVVGRLHRLWSWFDQHTINGHADVTLDWVDRYVSMHGFADMLLHVGWLKIDTKDGIECGITMPNFDRYNAESARKRELARLRQSRRRHADVTQPVTPTSRAPSRKMSRLQDSTVHNKKTPIVPLFETFWTAYPNKVGKPAAERAWERLNPDPPTVAALMAGLEQQRRDWTDPQFIPHPSTWLKNRRWEDQPARAAPSEAGRRPRFASCPSCGDGHRVWPDPEPCPMAAAKVSA